MNQSSDEGKPTGAMILEIPRRKDHYRAFNATEVPQERLIIYALTRFCMPRYDALQDIIFAGGYDFVGLLYPHQRVRISGRNLSGLVFSLRTHSVEWLREYVEPFHELPEDDGTLPVITGIRIEGAPINPFREE